AAEAVADRAVEGRTGIGQVVEVLRVVPGATEDVTPVAGPIQAPLPHVSPGVVGSERPQAPVSSDTSRPPAGEAARPPDGGERGQTRARRAPPVVHGRELLLLECAVRRGLVPAHPADRVVILSIGIRS